MLREVGVLVEEVVVVKEWVAFVKEELLFKRTVQNVNVHEIEDAAFELGNDFLESDQKVLVLLQFSQEHRLASAESKLLADILTVLSVHETLIDPLVEYAVVLRYEVFIGVFNALQDVVEVLNHRVKEEDLVHKKLPCEEDKVVTRLFTHLDKVAAIANCYAKVLLSICVAKHTVKASSCVLDVLSSFCY